ncbi:AraC family transcriptional regulator [uncultured Microbacterium sp.]|uniref:helix-turn-helix transcriptional regulator n=1 Tax=uncultured Microbacterium sp. TaxID=191216 RepID=UPI0025F53953|nr:AraC family transcriptional regulator [uncultured Microbacterium sp.]
MAIDPVALERTLRSLDVGLGVSRRHTLAMGEQLPFCAESATLVYVVAGTVAGERVVGAGGERTDACAVRPSADPEHPSSFTLSAGDALVAQPGSYVALRAHDDAEIVTESFTLDGGSSATLPGVFFVTGFADDEPAAAALAGSLAPIGVGTPRSGDPVICQLMVTTVLLSIIRSWAQNGCAPRGWPEAGVDPFLRRVVEAIDAEPAREWTLDLLAGVAAMSRSVFAERFRRAYGRSPGSYLTDVRMQHARAYLDAGRTVAETARLLGYASDEGFSRAFRRHVGIAPSRWRSEPLPAVV